MPIYVYECKLCEARFEELQKRDDRPAPLCCGVKAQRLISSPAVGEFDGSVGGSWMKKQSNEG